MGATSSKPAIRYIPTSTLVRPRVQPRWVPAPPTTTGGPMFKSADDLLAYVKDAGVEIIDVRFCDLPGIMQHFTVPAGSFGQEMFEDGVNFDGSSIRGFQKIHESDMTLL